MRQVQSDLLRCGLRRSSFLSCSLEDGISSCCSRYLELAVSFLPYRSGFTLETDVVYPSVFFAHRITLCRPISGIIRGHFRRLTKNIDKLLILAKVAARSGYSVTPVSPSSKDISMDGWVSSTSEKSTMFARLAYTRIRRGVKSPLPISREPVSLTRGKCNAIHTEL